MFFSTVTNAVEKGNMGRVRTGTRDLIQEGALMEDGRKELEPRGYWGSRVYPRAEARRYQPERLLKALPPRGM